MTHAYFIVTDLCLGDVFVSVFNSGEKRYFIPHRIDLLRLFELCGYSLMKTDEDVGFYHCRAKI